MRARLFGAALAVFGLLLGSLTTPALAEVNINVNIGPPPPVVVHERPAMVFLAEPAVYVAVGVPYDIYFISGRYYYMHGDNWFWAPGYEGPWVHVVYKSLPPGLQRYKVVKLHEFREREYRVYKVEGPKYRGKHFDADPGPNHKGDHDDHGDNDHGKGSNVDSRGGSSNGPGNSKGSNGKGRGRG